MEYWVLYLCSIADSVHAIFLTVGIIGMILSVILFVMSICNRQCSKCSMDICIAKGVGLLKIKTKSVLIPSLIAFILSALIPNSRSCYAIFGIGTTIQYINNTEEIKKLPETAAKAINCYLESITPNDSIK